MNTITDKDYMKCKENIHFGRNLKIKCVVTWYPHLSSIEISYIMYIHKNTHTICYWIKTSPTRKLDGCRREWTVSNKYIWTGGIICITRNNIYCEVNTECSLTTVTGSLFGLVMLNIYRSKNKSVFFKPLGYSTPWT